MASLPPFIYCGITGCFTSTLHGSNRESLCLNTWIKRTFSNLTSLFHGCFFVIILGHLEGPLSWLRVPMILPEAPRWKGEVP